jgi:arginine N-succinyltransferase
MFRIRNVKESDLEDIYELSKLQVFINLPANQEKLRKIIVNSIASFKSPSKQLENNYFLFALEDISKKKVIGVSMIHGKHGTDAEPHFYLRVSREHKFSTTINTGFIHGTLKLGTESNGWSEIGGLILDPKYRGNELKLGKQLSFVRFLYITNHPELFTKNIHCELMPPFDEEGKSPLWEAIGRRFMNMNYDDADRLSRENKEFILSLYPSDTIYETLLPLHARNAIGKVGKSTQPVKKMLESIGFKYMNEVDPFDGGPHYRCLQTEIKPIKERYSGKLNTDFDKSKDSRSLLVRDTESDDLFSAFITKGYIDKDILHAELDNQNEMDTTAIFTDF